MAGSGWNGEQPPCYLQESTQPKSLGSVCYEAPGKLHGRTMSWVGDLSCKTIAACLGRTNLALWKLILQSRVYNKPAIVLNVFSRLFPPKVFP